MSQVVSGVYQRADKSQGSEYPVVVIPVTLQHLVMLHRNLLYTGVTRGKRLVILVGEKKACAVAVYGTMTKPRYTKLREWGEIYRKPP